MFDRIFKKKSSVAEPTFASMGGRVKVVIDPEEAYPRALVEITKSLDVGEAFSNMGLAILIQQARRVAKEDWELASKVEEDISPYLRERRAVVLDILRKWFVERAHEKINHRSMYLTIAKPISKRWLY